MSCQPQVQAVARCYILTGMADILSIIIDAFVACLSCCKSYLEYVTSTF